MRRSAKAYLVIGLIKIREELNFSVTAFSHYKKIHRSFNVLSPSFLRKRDKIYKISIN